MESTHSGIGWKPVERSQTLILSRFGSILPPLLLHVEKKVVLGMNCSFHLQLRGKVSSTQVRFVYTNPQWYAKSGKDPLSLLLAWFWQDNDIFLEGHNMLCLLVMSGLPCWGWHTEHPILQEPPSPRPTSRDFCYIDFKTDIHCQARSLYHPASQWGIFLMFKFTQQPTVIQGVYRGLFRCLTYTGVTWCKLYLLSFVRMEGKPAYLSSLLPSQVGRTLLGLSLHGWEREGCHATSHSKRRLQD